MPEIDPIKQTLVQAATPHVVFDGWSPAAYDAAVSDAGIDSALAARICPRGAVDLAIAYHQMGDAAMVKAVAAADMSDMRFRDKVALAIRLRLGAITDKDVVRRGTALFALPHMAPDGARLIWSTADLIWTTLGDRSDDVNWYTKRATLSGVYASVVLYWLGDTSVEDEATHAFVDRRIEEVMQIEKTKAQMRDNPLFKPFAGPLARMASAIKPPNPQPLTDLPGQWRDVE